MSREWAGHGADILQARTPAAWYRAAAARLPELLVDHASCEKKAASTAIALMFAYADDAPLARELSRLAREELRHFEQVAVHMGQLGIAHERLAPGRYGSGLRAAMDRDEPQRKLDLLLCGALIEARSCERFAGLVEVLSGSTAALYAGLQAAEARHAGLYLHWAARCAAQHPGCGDWRRRLQELALVEAALATQPDAQFRFHSGVPES